LGNFLLTLVKLVLTVFLLPLVYACTLKLHAHFDFYPGVYYEMFRWGLIVFLVSFLFIHQFWEVQEFGQKIMLNLFQFMAPLDRFVSYLLPFYVIVVMLVFYVTTRLLGINSLDGQFMSLSGFVFGMHILISAQDLQNQEKTPVKANYMFVILFAFIMNICILILLMDLTVGRFTFLAFISSVAAQAQEFYAGFFKQYFIS